MEIQQREALDSAINKAFDLSARERVLLREEVLTDFFGEKRATERFYFILVDVQLYLVPVKCLQMSVGSSLVKQPPQKIVLHHLAHLDRIKSIRLETRPPKLMLPMLDKILTLLIEFQVASTNEDAAGPNAGQTGAQTLSTTAMETDMQLRLSGLATDRPAAAVETVSAASEAAPPMATTSETPDAPPPSANGEAGAADGPAASKTVGCCGARRATGNDAAAVDEDDKPQPATTPAPPSTRTVNIYLNYYRQTHPERDWAFQQLRDAWSKQVLKRTLEFDSDYLLLTTRRSSVRLTDSDYRLLFDGLVGDLERAVGDAAGLSDLLLELFMSLKRYFIIKKLFWETPKLFELLVVTMETVAKEQCSDETLTEIERRQHGNQLKVLLHALQALNCSFEDTEALASRYRSLHQSESRLIPLLVSSLCSLVLIADGRHTWGDDGEQEVVTDQVAIYRALLLERARAFYHLMAGCSDQTGRQEDLTPIGLCRTAVTPVNRLGFLAFVTDCLRHCARHFDFYGRVRSDGPVAQMRPEIAVQLFEALDALRRILLTSNEAWSSARACPELLVEIRHFLRRSRVTACLRRDLPLRDAFLVLADDLRRVLQLHLTDPKTDDSRSGPGLTAA